MKYLGTLNNQLKKTIISKISTILLGLEFKPDNIITSKDINVVFKKYCLFISNNEKVLCQS